LLSAVLVDMDIPGLEAISRGDVQHAAFGLHLVEISR
jgi:hypothetical protein